MTQYDDIPTQLLTLLQTLLTTSVYIKENQYADIVQMIDSLNNNTNMIKAQHIKFLVELLTQILNRHSDIRTITSLLNVMSRMQQIVNLVMNNTPYGSQANFVCRSFFLLKSVLNQLLKQQDLELKLRNHIESSQKNIKTVQKRLKRLKIEKEQTYMEQNTILKNKIKQLRQKSQGSQDQIYKLLQSKQFSINQLNTMIVQLKQQKNQLEQQNQQQNTQYEQFVNSQKLANEQKQIHLDNIHQNLQIQQTQIKLQQQQIKKQTARLQRYRQVAETEFSQSTKSIQAELTRTLQQMMSNNQMYKQQLQKQKQQNAHQQRLLATNAQQYATQQEKYMHLSVQHQNYVQKSNETINDLKKIRRQIDSQLATYKYKFNDLNTKQLQNLQSMADRQIQVETLKRINMQQLNQKQTTGKQLIRLNEELQIEKQLNLKFQTQLNSVKLILTTMTAEYQKQQRKSLILEKQNKQLQQQKNQYRTIINTQCQQLAKNIKQMKYSEEKQLINKQALNVLDKLALQQSDKILQFQKQNNLNLQKLQKSIKTGRNNSETKLRQFNNALQLQAVQTKKTQQQSIQIIDKLTKLNKYVSQQIKSNTDTSKIIQFKINDNARQINKQSQAIQRNSNIIQGLSQKLNKTDKKFESFQKMNSEKRQQIRKLNKFVDSQIVKIKQSINQTQTLNLQQFKSTEQSIQQLNKQLHDVIQRNRSDGLMKIDELQKYITTYIENFTKQLDITKHKGMIQIESIRQNLQQTKKLGGLQINKLKKKIKLNETYNQKEMGLIIQNLIRIDQNQIDSQSQILKIKQELMEDKKMESALYRYKKYIQNKSFVYN